MDTSWVFGLKEFLTTIVAIGGAVAVIYGWIIRPFKKQAELDQQQQVKIDSLITKVDNLEKKVDANQAEYVRDRLQTMHEKYCNELGWASAEEKRRIVDWYEDYRNRGYNHLAESYADDIIKLPEKPISKD